MDQVVRYELVRGVIIASIRRSARKVMNSASNTLTLLTEGAPRVHARA